MWTKLVFSNLKAKDVTLFLLTFSLFPQDSAHICEDEPNTTKAQPKRLRSLDTFRGYVATVPCLSIHHHMRPIHMLILFRAVWGMMKIYSPSIMNNYRGHSLATGSPKLFFFLSGGIALGIMSDISASWAWNSVFLLDRSDACDWIWAPC